MKNYTENTKDDVKQKAENAKQNIKETGEQIGTYDKNSKDPVKPDNAKTFGILQTLQHGDSFTHFKAKVFGKNENEKTLGDKAQEKLP